MKKNVAISVLMLTYNRERMVGYAIESVLKQTFQKFEFIIVDNGSTDGSGRIADEYANKDSRVQVFHVEKGSIGYGRNIALANAKGDYIAFIDDDDWISPYYLQCLFEMIQDDGIDIAICGISGKTSEEEIVLMSNEQAIETMLFRKRFGVGFPTKLINKRLFKEIEFNEESRFDDIYLMPEIISRANSVAYTGKGLYFVQRHDNNNSAWTQDYKLITKDILTEYLEVYKQRTKMLIHRFPNKESAWRYFEASFWISMVDKISRYKLEGCNEIRKQLLTQLSEVKDEFLTSEYIQDFEKEWVKQYMDKFILNKLTIIITTRCNLRCKLCCEYVPQNKSFEDITVEKCESIVEALFENVDYIKTLHLSGGGEPFLHRKLDQLIEVCMKYQDRFERFMLFTNGTVTPSEQLQKALSKYGKKIVVQVSRYGINPEKEQNTVDILTKTGVTLKIEKYYGEDQSFGGWVDFGPWRKQDCEEGELTKRFEECAVTRDMRGNWRTRDGKIHWCSRSQRGMELGYIPDNPDDYVDIFDGSSRNEKQEKFISISKRYLAACDFCSGNAGTKDTTKRYPAAEQMEVRR